MKPRSCYKQSVTLQSQFSERPLVGGDHHSPVPRRTSFPCSSTKAYCSKPWPTMIIKLFFKIKLLILCYSGMFEKISLICYYLRRKFMYLRHLYLPISSWTIHILCWVFYWMLVSPKVTTLVCHVDARILPN